MMYRLTTICLALAAAAGSVFTAPTPQDDSPVPSEEIFTPQDDVDFTNARVSDAAFFNNNNNQDPKYKLKCFPPDQIVDNLVVANSTNQPNMDPKLYGLWHLDGIPLPDEVVSFGTSKQIGDRTFRIDVWRDGCWSWHDTRGGRNLWRAAYAMRLTYDVEFNEDYTFGQVTPRIRPFDLGVWGPDAVVIGEYLADFELRYESEGVYIRDSKFFNSTVAPYTFRRLVDANGKRIESAWENYLANAPKQVCVASIVA
ncbi:hypothetical protein HK102_003142 [Quaeritorhiza haematococci]|nr:hypothetical protein HK102_003142 [Quaeritorhiza haematococci]